MKKVVCSFSAILIALFLSPGIYCQSVNASEKIPASNGYPQVNLYMDLDKSTYMAGENIWLSGYCINHDKNLKDEQNTLYALLIDAVNRKLITKGRYIIQQGIGKGCLAIPDSVPAGSYWVLGYTNAWIEHGKQPLFKQLISIRTATADPFHIASSVMPFNGDDTFRVKYHISTDYNGLAAGGKFDYTIYDDTLQVESGSQIIDPFGEVVLPFDAAKTPYRDLQITAKVSRNGQSKSFILPLSITPPVTAGLDLSGPIQFPIKIHGSGPNAMDLMAINQLQQHPDLTSPNNTEPSSVKSVTPPVTHLPSHPIVTITPDSSEYHRTTKVTLHIRVRDSLNRPVSAIFSLSVAAASSLDTNRMQPISDYVNQPDSLYVQKGSDASLYGHPVNFNDRMPDSGYVLYDGHSPHRPIALALMGNALITLTTDTAGRFQLPFEALATPVGGFHYLSVTEKEVDRYKIMTFSKADRISEQLATTYHPAETFVPDNPDTSDLRMPIHAGMLQAAVVKAKAASQYNWLTGDYNSTNCAADFVCTHQHSRSGFEPDNLNCPMVKFDSCRLERPVEGRKYLYIRDTSMVRPGGKWSVRLYQVVYHCAVPYLPPFVKMLDPILGEKHFTPQDSSTLHTVGNGFQSTVYWEPARAIIKDKDDEVTITYYTNHHHGKFICRLQGLSTVGPIEQTAVYSVKQY